MIQTDKINREEELRLESVIIDDLQISEENKEDIINDDKTKELRDVLTVQEGKVFKEKAQIDKAKRESCCYKWCCCGNSEKNNKNNNDNCCDDLFWYWYWYWYFSNRDTQPSSLDNNCDCKCCDCDCSECLESCCKGFCDCISNLDCDCDDD